MATFDRVNPFQSELFERNVLLPYLEDYRNITNFSRFMGGSDAVIYNKMENKGLMLPKFRILLSQALELRRDWQVHAGFKPILARTIPSLRPWLYHRVKLA